MSHRGGQGVGGRRLRASGVSECVCKLRNQSTSSKGQTVQRKNRFLQILDCVSNLV